MKNIAQFSVLLSFLLFTGLLQAEQTKLDKSMFVGIWNLDAARPHLEKDVENRNKNLEDTPFKYLAGDDKKANKETWTFKDDGTFLLEFYDHRASGEVTSKTSYEIDGATLKIAKLGRPGKFYRYKLIGREDNKMILKGGLEGYYFLSKK